MYAKLITIKTGNVTEYVIFGDSETLSELAHALNSASRGEGVAPILALDEHLAFYAPDCRIPSRKVILGNTAGIKSRGSNDPGPARLRYYRILLTTVGMALHRWRLPTGPLFAIFRI
jgi:hypothetical protein